MCTVVVRWSPDASARVLALRDELVGREFDDPGTWWPSYPGVVGGRDRSAGGSWCVTRVATATTALVLNRPERRVAAEDAPSRGVLPLLAVTYGAQWVDHVELSGMASFAVVLVAPDALVLWVFDGQELRRTDLGEGTHMVTSGGAEDGKSERYLGAFRDGEDWLEVVRTQQPQDDPAALVVRHAVEDRVFATVFGQLIDARAGALDLRFSRTPTAATDWDHASWDDLG